MAYDLPEYSVAINAEYMNFAVCPSQYFTATRYDSPAKIMHEAWSEGAVYASMLGKAGSLLINCYTNLRRLGQEYRGGTGLLLGSGFEHFSDFHEFIKVAHVEPECLHLLIAI